MSNASEAFKKLQQCVRIEFYIGKQAAKFIEDACCGKQVKPVAKAPEEKAKTKQDFPSSDSGHKSKKAAKVATKSED